MAKEIPVDRTPPGEERPRRRRGTTQSTESNAKGAKETTPPEFKPKTRSAADKKLAAQIAGAYGTAGLIIIGVGGRVGDPGIVGAGAQTIGNADQLADAWLDLCDTNPKVRAYLVKFTQASATGTLVGLHVMLLVPILVSRGMVPAALAEMVGVEVDPGAFATPNGGDPNSN